MIKIVTARKKVRIVRSRNYFFSPLVETSFHIKPFCHNDYCERQYICMVLLDRPHFECLITFVSTFAILASKQENSVDQVIVQNKRGHIYCFITGLQRNKRNLSSVFNYIVAKATTLNWVLEYFPNKNIVF